MVAMRSSGLSIYQLAPPIILFVMLTTVLTASLSMYARPWGNRNLQHELWDIARTRASAGLKPQVFNDEFPGMVIYAEHIDSKDDHLFHVMISDERDPDQHNTVFAIEGLMISDNETQTVTLRLLNGTVYTSSDDGKGDYHTDFETYDVNLDLRESMSGMRAKEEDDPKDMTLPELREAIARKQADGKSYAGELVEFHRKFAIPFACVVFGLVGRAARHRTGPSGEVTRLRGQPVRDLRLLHPALHRAGARRAGKHPRVGRSLAAELRLRTARDLPRATGGARARPVRHVAPRPRRAAARGAERAAWRRSLAVTSGGRPSLPAAGDRQARRPWSSSVPSRSRCWPSLAIYVLADFFDRFDSFLQHDARAGAIIRLFLYRIPLIVTQVTPVAVLAGGLVGLGLLARQNEFVAMRACGVSIWQILLPLSLVAVVISVAGLRLERDGGPGERAALAPDLERGDQGQTGVHRLHRPRGLVSRRRRLLRRRPGSAATRAADRPDGVPARVRLPPGPCDPRRHRNLERQRLGLRRKPDAGVR